MNFKQMKKLVFFVVSILLMGISCNDSNDAIYLSHKLTLEVTQTNDYMVEFSWNDIYNANIDGYYLVVTNESKGSEFYYEVVDYYMNYYEDYYPEWIYETDVYYRSPGSNSAEIYTWGDQDIRYYKLVAYNNKGLVYLSNIVVL